MCSEVRHCSTLLSRIQAGYMGKEPVSEVVTPVGLTQV